MKLEETIQQAFDYYPSLFQKRQQVLDQLFCVIGNGYDWKDGELILDIHCLEEEERAPNWKPVLDNNGKAIQRKKDKLTENLNKLKAELYGKKDLKPHWYPIIKNYSYICNYPKDIKPDWMAGIEETKKLLRKAKIRIPRNKMVKPNGKR
jgi:hypothetical protein